MSKSECPECFGEYEQLGKHWAVGSCDYPNLTSRQMEIVTGMVMGDGYIHNHSTGKNPHFRTNMTNRRFLEWLDSELGCFSKGVSLAKTAQQSADSAKKAGFVPDAREENFSDQYYVKSVTLPCLQQFGDWYGTGNKRFPADIELTPLITKVWYCCDGCYFHSDRENNPRLSIGVSNEIERSDFLKGLFRDITGEPGLYSDSLVFNGDQAGKLLEYMGEPLPGFKYKWGVDE